MAEALAAAASIVDKNTSADELGKLAGSLSDGTMAALAREALLTARAAVDEDRRASDLTWLAEYMPYPPDADGPPPGKDVLPAVRAMADKRDFATALAKLFLPLPKAAKATVIKEALAAAAWAFPQCPAEALSARCSYAGGRKNCGHEGTTRAAPERNFGRIPCVGSPRALIVVGSRPSSWWRPGYDRHIPCDPRRLSLVALISQAAVPLETLQLAADGSLGVSIVSGWRPKPRCVSGAGPDFVQNTLKWRLWGKAHGSIRIQEGQPRIFKFNFNELQRSALVVSNSFRYQLQPAAQKLCRDQLAARAVALSPLESQYQSLSSATSSKRILLESTGGVVVFSCAVAVRSAFPLFLDPAKGAVREIVYGS